DGVNGLAPGRRPAHTLCPVMVFRDGAPRWVYASPGGVGQTAVGTQILFSLIERHLPLAQAVNQPRWSVNRGGDLRLEPSFGDIAAALETWGYAPKVRADAYNYGSAKIVEYLQDGRMTAIADNRREAFAAGR